MMGRKFIITQLERCIRMMKTTSVFSEPWRKAEDRFLTLLSRNEIKEHLSPQKINGYYFRYKYIDTRPYAHAGCINIARN